MIAHSILAAALLGVVGEARSPWTLEMDLDLEYSLYLDIYRMIAERSRAEGGAGPLGMRASLSLGRERWLASLSFTFFPSNTSLAFSNDLYLAWVKRWRRVRLMLGGGAGYLVASRGTLVPTYTDHYAGPSLHGRTQLLWQISSRFHASIGGSIFVYPIQPLVIVPVGLDFRWTIGAGMTL
jgi:hypothetical protein